MLRLIEGSLKVIELYDFQAHSYTNGLHIHPNSYSIGTNKIIATAADLAKSQRRWLASSCKHDHPVVRLGGGREVMPHNQST